MIAAGDQSGLNWAELLSLPKIDIDERQCLGLRIFPLRVIPQLHPKPDLQYSGEAPQDFRLP
jgi:hypothetical protein